VKLTPKQRKKRQREAQRRYAVRNKDKILARRRKYREEHRDEKRAKDREYYARNRERINARRRELIAAKKHHLQLNKDNITVSQIVDRWVCA